MISKPMFKDAAGLNTSPSGISAHSAEDCYEVKTDVGFLDMGGSIIMNYFLKGK